MPSRDDIGPDQRQAAHSARATTDGGGPSPLDPASGLTETPGVAATPSSTTQAPTRRPCNSMRTRLPTRISEPNDVGTE